LDEFGNLSGLKINSSKTEGMWIGSLKNNEEKPFGIKWPCSAIKALGVFFSYDDNQFCTKNLNENRLDSIKKQISVWSSTGLSVYGKVTVIKSFLIPKFVFISSLLPTPNKFIKDLNQLIFKFLWNGKDKIRRISAIDNYEEGPS